MKLKVRVPQVRAAQLTIPRANDDEIYLAYMVTVIRAANGVPEARWVGGKCSTQQRVQTNLVWAPQGLDAEFDLGEGSAAQIAFAVYEADDGKIHKLLSDKVKDLPTGKMDWSKIPMPPLTIPKTPPEWLALLAWAGPLVEEAFKYLASDDRIATQIFDVMPDVPGFSGRREYNFEGLGGDYRVAVDLS